MKEISRLNFAHLPTRIEALPRLTSALEGPEIFVKRDDQTGLAFGGNKTRKLEFLVAEAQAAGAKTLITAGAVQSNHCRQTAAAAAKYGFKCILVLAGDPPQHSSANFLLDQYLGAEIIWANWETRRQDLQVAYDAAVTAGQEPYLVPYGGSSPTGAAGYAYAIQELLTQGLIPDWIVFPSSSAGTQAGMVAGAKLFGLDSKIFGISVDEPEQMLKERVAELATQTMDLFGIQHTFVAEEILVNADFCAAGYGVLTANEIEAIQLFSQLEGLLIDPVYTGRAAGGLISLIRKQFFSPDEKVLFWHTGGTPALFAQKYQNLTVVKKEL
jgi:D-cysteine desulfhydrase family pyridoxal phosphate-dependent enzyme